MTTRWARVSTTSVGRTRNFISIFVKSITFGVRMRRMFPLFPFSQTKFSFSRVSVVPHRVARRLRGHTNLVIRKGCCASFVTTQVQLGVFTSSSRTHYVFALVLSTLHRGKRPISHYNSSTNSNALIRVTKVLRRFNTIKYTIR